MQIAAVMRVSFQLASRRRLVQGFLFSHTSELRLSEMQITIQITPTNTQYSKLL